MVVQCNLNSVTLNLPTTCDLVPIFQRPFCNLVHKNHIFRDIMRFSDSLYGDQKCPKSRVHCTTCEELS